MWLQSILEHVNLTDLAVGAFSAERQERLAEEFRRSDQEQIETTQARVRRISAVRLMQARDLFREQDQALLAYAGKKRRHEPVSTLLDRAPDVLLSLKPCWAMSPLVVSQILPARPLFDVVVFDEASQIMPADAMTSILRGRQAVVAGDERQLPPTAFFVSETSEDQEDEEEAQALAAIASAVDFESILDALKPLLPKWRMLQWHYRSRDERLIAFSNANFYDRSLTKFPGVGGDMCLRHVVAPWAPGSDTNSPSPRGGCRGRAHPGARPKPTRRVSRRDRHGYQAREPHRGDTSPATGRPARCRPVLRRGPGGAVLRQEPGTGPGTDSAPCSPLEGSAG